jgi:hypothetical protein
MPVGGREDESDRGETRPSIGLIRRVGDPPTSPLPSARWMVPDEEGVTIATKDTVGLLIRR